MKENVFLIDDYYFSSSLLFILIYHHRIVFLLFHKLWTNMCLVGLNLSEKKQKERKVALVVVTDSHDSRSLKKTATHQKKKASSDVTHFIQSRPRSLLIVVLYLQSGSA
jgi:hypothetical protein